MSSIVLGTFHFQILKPAEETLVCGDLLWRWRESLAAENTFCELSPLFLFRARVRIRQKVRDGKRLRAFLFVAVDIGQYRRDERGAHHVAPVAVHQLADQDCDLARAARQKPHAIEAEFDAAKRPQVLDG